MGRCIIIKTIFVTLYNPKNYTRPFLVKNALGEKNVITKYVSSAPGMSNIKIEPVRKLTRLLKMYTSFSSKIVDGVICLNPYPLGRILKYSFSRWKPYVIDYMDVNLDKNLELVNHEKKILNASKGVIFWSKSFKELLSNKLSTPYTTYIPSGLDQLTIEKLDTLSRVKSQKKVKTKVITYFGYSWRINGREVQGIYDLIKAVAIVKKEIKDIQLVLSGIIPDDNLIAYVKAVKLTDISFIPPTPYGSYEFLNRLVKSDILALPTTSHPTVYYAEQHKLFFYMAAQKPIVATAIPGTCGVLNNTMATFAKPNDSVSLSSAIFKVLCDSKLADDTSTAAHKRLLEQYTWEKLAVKYHDFIVDCFTN